MIITYLKKFKWVITAVGVLASSIAIFQYIDERGYNRAYVEIQAEANEKIQKATKEAVIKATKKMQVALNRQQVIHDAELNRVAGEKIVEVETEKVIEYVDKIQIKNECSTVSDDIIGLLNKSVNNSNITRF